jgi:septal ring factor EnvC (AmiA/AmiB activator)
MKPHLVHPADPAPEPRVEQEIQRLLIQRRQAIQALAWADAELAPLRKRYAAERGEYMLPTIERLTRELLR